MSNYLARHFDPELDLSGISSREELEKQQVERIKYALSVVILCGAIPRRLGADANSEELALDKKRARRVGHALKQALNGWTKKTGELPVTDKMRREGAQLNWEKWQSAYVADIRVRLRYVSSYAILKEEEDWGKSAVVRLENELNWVEYALRS